MPQLAIAAAGAAIGAGTLGTGVVAFGLTGTAIGWTAGSILGNYLLPPKSNAQIADLRAPKIQLGASMPRIYGAVRVPLSPRWQSTWRATENSAGGKGGGGAEYYTYSCDLLTWVSDVAGLPAEMRVAGWSRIWWNGELVATRLVDSGVESIEVEGGGKWGAVTFHGGADDQLPWSVYETAIGAENADAHRRVACISFEGLNAGTWSNLPLLEAEVYTNGTVDDLEGVAALQLGPWENTGRGEMPRHSLGTTTYRYPASGTAIYEGTDLNAAIAAMQADYDWATVYLGYYTSVNGKLSSFSSGDDASSDISSGNGARYVYLAFNYELPEMVDDSLGNGPGLSDQEWCTGITTCALGEPTPSVMSTWFPEGVGTGGASNGHTGIGKMFPPGEAASFPYSLGSGDGVLGANCVSCPDSGGVYPVVKVIKHRFIRVERQLVVPDGYTLASGDFKQLRELEQDATVVNEYPIGPVLRDTDPDDTQAFWDAAAAAAGVTGTYGVDYPVDATQAGVKTVEAVQLGTVDLADIVSAECLRSGLTAGDIDVSDLAGIAVRGFIATGPARQAIEELMTMFQFYAVCSDKLYFRLLDADAVLSVPHGDTGAGVGEAKPPFTGLERGNDLEVPSAVTVVSPNPSADYDAGAETSDRLVTAGRRRERVESSVVLTPAERKGRANALVLDARVALHTGTLSISDDYAQIEPGDVLTVADEEGSTYTVRAVRESYADGVHDLEVRLFDKTVLTLEGTTSDTYAPVITIAQADNTDLVLLDTGLLRDEDDGMHLLAAVQPAEAGRWGGASIYRSVDGSAYASVASTATRAVIGQATTQLADFTGWTWDETGSVTVNVGSNTLASSTTAAMQADATLNVAALGQDGRWEVFRYRTATLVSAGVYTLTGLLRGLYGTDTYRDSHTASDTFVKLTAAALERIAVPLSDLGLVRYWKGVTARQQVSAAAEQTLSPDGVALKPWAPAALAVARDGGNNATISWHGRSRLSIRYGGVGGSVVQPDATLTGYRVRIYSTATFATVLRTEDVTDAEYVYSAANQTADGLTPGDPLHIGITQTSSLVGEGYALQETA